MGGTANGFPGVPMVQRNGRGKLRLKAWSPRNYWLEGRGRGHHRMQCQEGGSSGSRGGAVHSSRPRLPSRRRQRGTGTPEVGEPESTCANSPYPGPRVRGESQGRQGPLCQRSKMPSCRASPPPTNRFRKPFKPRLQLDVPGLPRPSPG